MPGAFAAVERNADGRLGASGQQKGLDEANVLEDNVAMFGSWML
jgi:hypothetical protein